MDSTRGENVSLVTYATNVPGMVVNVHNVSLSPNLITTKCDCRIATRFDTRCGPPADITRLPSATTKLASV